MKSMNRLLGLAAAIFSFCILSVQAGAVRSSQSTSPKSASAPVSAGPAVINQYCSNCHNADDFAGGMDILKLDFEKVGKDAAVWERVVRKVRTGMMPPSGQPRPSRAVLDGFASELETRLDRLPLPIRIRKRFPSIG